MSPAGKSSIRLLIGGVLASIGLGLLLGALAGTLAGWAAAAIVLLLLVLWQTRQLLTLADWLQAPDAPGPPVLPSAWQRMLLQRSDDRRRTAATLRKVEAHLRSFTEAMNAVPDGLLILDAGQCIQWGNRAAEAHLDIDLARDTGESVERLVRNPGFGNYLREPDPQSPFILQTATARTRLYALRVVPLSELSKLLISIDVTDVRRLEAMRSEFVANVSHELRTPLTVVSGFLEHFANGNAMTSEQQQHFSRLMSDQTARMLSLVDDLLTLSRLEAEDAPASEETVNMADLLQQLQSEAQSLSEQAHRLEMRCDGPALRGNRKELHSAFGNLVSNAIRYTPAGGTIRINWRVSDGLGIFAVHDSGVGIAAEHLPRLTERFYRVDRGRSRDTGGTGLGLAIVKHILLRHQATLVIESQIGQGSTFRAEFPAWRLQAPD
ncbi:MAG: phosphate regulon sensor histidine kinase PhoR [Candidatus Accumulibacter sp.]|nr:phosphate regulon sensor histidine kinase PhoR [Accumulibacter sp.]